MKQTAVEWLYALSKKRELDVFDLEQSKEMEKKQLIGLLEWMNKISQQEPMRLETDHDDIVQQYYNETYKSDKK
jgi:hypothetical protein